MDQVIFLIITKIGDICRMIAVIKGDIIHSRGVKNPEEWLQPLKSVLKQWGKTVKKRDMAWGDAFQLELSDPLEALKAAFSIKATLKSIPPPEKHKQNSLVDVRMAVGIGEKQYAGKLVSESNDSAYILSGEKFEKLKKEKITLAIRSPFDCFNEEMNLYLKLGMLFMDKWSVSSAELVKIILEQPNITQEEAGKILGIKQNSVSKRWSRANIDEMLDIEYMYQRKLKMLLP